MSPKQLDEFSCGAGGVTDRVDSPLAPSVFRALTGALRVDELAFERAVIGAPVVLAFTLPAARASGLSLHQIVA